MPTWVTVSVVNHSVGHNVASNNVLVKVGPDRALSVSSGTPLLGVAHTIVGPALANTYQLESLMLRLLGEWIIGRSIGSVFVLTSSSSSVVVAFWAWTCYALVGVSYTSKYCFMRSKKNFSSLFVRTSRSTIIDSSSLSSSRTLRALPIFSLSDSSSS